MLPPLSPPPPQTPPLPPLLPPQTPPAPPVSPLCYSRRVLPRHRLHCSVYIDDEGYPIDYDCGEHRICDRAAFEDDWEDHDCERHMLPAADSYTSFYLCDWDCSVIECPQCPRIECPQRKEEALLQHAGITRAAWEAYVRRLYGVPSAAQPRLPRIDEVDMVYTRMLPLGGVESTGYDDCPRSGAHAPMWLGQPHVVQAAYYAAAAAPLAIPSHGWAEVTHCGSHVEEEGAWFYVNRGSAIYVNVGRTIAFREHYEAATYFNSYGDISGIPRAARAAGYDSVQFKEHCEGCRCDHELMLTRADGTETCPGGVELRTGLDASKPCICAAVAIGTEDRAWCIACTDFAYSL